MAENETSSVPLGEEKSSAEFTTSSSDFEKPAISETAVDKTEEKGEETIEKTKDEDQYLHGLPLGLVTLGLCLAVFVVALDNTIIATAIPKITDRFRSLEDVGWYASAYLLTTGAFQLLFGRIYSTFSIKWAFISALGLFELGSLICGAAPNSTTLIVGRAVAGLGAAGIFSGGMIIMSEIVPLHIRPIYLGLVGGMYGIASVAGPLLGGVFTDRITWRLCFYINLPIGFVTVVTIIFLYHPRERDVASLGWKARLKTFDLTGNAVLMPAIISLFLGLQWGGTKYAWSNGRIIALLTIFGILIIIFIGMQFWKPENAMIPPRLIKQRSVWSGGIYTFFLAGTFFILSFYLPIWFQAVKGVSAVRSGIMNLPLILGTVAAILIAGAGTTALGYYTPFIYVSTVVVSIGTGMLTTFTVNTASPAWIGWQVMAGLGVGFGMQLPMIAVQAVLPTADIPSGTALIIFVQTLGGAIFVSVGQTIFTNKLVANLHRFVPSVDALGVLQVGATKIHDQFDGEVLEGIILSYNESITQTFLVAVIIAALTVFGSACMEWRSVKEKKDGSLESGVANTVDSEVKMPEVEVEES